MLISREHQFIFIHLYKTAGTSIKQVLRPLIVNGWEWAAARALKKLKLPVPASMDPTPYPEHATAAELRSAMGPEAFDRKFSFAFVRNPWDWQVSLYKYMLKTPAHFQHEKIRRMDNFKEYVFWRCQEEVRLQKNMICSEEGDVLVDYVGRFERLEEDFAEVCRHIGLPSLSLPRTNVSNTRPYRTFYDRESRKWVEEAFAPDIEMFGYEF
ncbi:MAG: sulfotransferase family 2 domain-containing protein [Balneolaceae bacterium]|nr:sulfotransferase family 2 domain-containing protein [Balneolaceae bacterium]